MKKIDANELESMMRKNHNIFVINTLSAEDFALQHIPNSINIPLNSPDFIQQVEKRVRDRKAAVVVYCSGGRCESSARAGKMLERTGYTNLHHFHGGMEEWLLSGKRAESRRKRAA